MIAQPIGRFVSDSEWELVDDWSVDTVAGRLHIDAGYRSDGTSIPRFLWSSVGPRFSGDTFPAALAHDAMYSAHLPDIPGWRAVADAAFLDLLARLGVGRVKREAYYAAVRLFGWLVASQHTDISVEASRRQVRLETI